MYNRFKKEILDNCQVLKIINCNPNLFGTIASSECTIIVFKKCKGIKNYETEVIDYSDDGYGYENGVRVKKKEGTINSYKEVLEYNKDWNYKKKDWEDTSFIGTLYSEKKTEYLNKLKKLEETGNFNSIIEETLEYYKTLKQTIENKDNNFTKKKVLLSDLFEYIPVKTFTTKTEKGNIPLFGATIEHKPINFINDYSFDTEESEDESIRQNGIVLINKTGNGGAGLCFKHKGKFAILGTVYVYKMKMFIDDYNINYIGTQLHKIYNRANSFSNVKLKTQEVNIVEFK